jgi:succinate dehydrogenase/fumarate reductase cytochrome b subunit
MGIMQNCQMRVQNYNTKMIFQWLHKIIGSANSIFLITHSLLTNKMLAFLQANRKFFLKNRKYNYRKCFEKVS